MLNYQRVNSAKRGDVVHVVLQVPGPMDRRQVTANGISEMDMKQKPRAFHARGETNFLGQKSHVFKNCISNIYVIKKRNIAIVWFVHWLVHWFIAEVWTHIHLTNKNCGCWSFPPLTWRVSQKKRCQLFLDCQRITFLSSLILFPCLNPHFCWQNPFQVHSKSMKIARSHSNPRIPWRKIPLLYSHFSIPKKPLQSPASPFSVKVAQSAVAQHGTDEERLVLQ